MVQLLTIDRLRALTKMASLVGLLGIFFILTSISITLPETALAVFGLVFCLYAMSLADGAKLVFTNQSVKDLIFGYVTTVGLLYYLYSDYSVSGIESQNVIVQGLLFMIVAGIAVYLLTSVTDYEHQQREQDSNNGKNTDSETPTYGPDDQWEKENL